MLVEITTFRLADGIDEERFLEADRRVQNEFIPNLPGFVRRTTARGGDGDWAVIVLWWSAEQADDAARIAGDHAVMKAFTSFVDGSTFQVQRFTTLD